MFENLPITYLFALVICALMVILASINIRKEWSLPFLSVIFMFLLWYMVEPLYSPDQFKYFSDQIIFDAYFYCIAFLVFFFLFFVGLSPIFRPSVSSMPANFGKAYLSRELGRAVPRLMFPFAFVWVALVIIGSLRLGGDVIQALFPLDGRSGSVMWQRSGGAGAGSAGFLVAAASYLYLLVSAGFGAMLPLARKNSTRIFLLVLICLSWPYLFLQGSRNQTLIAFLPLIISFIIFGRANIFIKASITLAGAIFINYWFGIVIQMRNEQTSITNLSSVNEVAHLGLNMASELCWMLSFQKNGILQPSLGTGYLVEAVNFVPRVIWPGKPLIGIDYAILRGFGSDSGELGVIATISTGIIGQGMGNFGPFFGASFAGFAMACWANFLWRLRLQATAPRQLLFVLGIALTINLGRDITLLTLFPFLFGYLGVLFLERGKGRRW